VTSADETKISIRVLGDPADNLSAFLACHGHTIADLPGQVSTSLGNLHMLVAGGSVVVGYANARSDIDLYAVGDFIDPQGVPAISHELGPLLDITLLPQVQLHEQLTWLRDTSKVVTGHSPARTWARSAKACDYATRIACGLVLRATPEWAALQESLRSQWLIDRCVTWWRLEARRHLVTARWLAAANPPLAAQLACEAQLAALKAVTAEAGYVFFNRKWVSRELLAMGRDDLIHQYRQALRAAWLPQAPMAESAAMVDRTIGEPTPDLVVHVSYARGVATHRLRESTLVSRWEMSGILLPTTDLPVARRDGRVIWSGGLDDWPPDWLHELASRGMVWIGVAHED
jgi:hypothetical protein